MGEDTGPKVIVYPDDDQAPPTAIDAAEVRVLGALVEKQLTTPDYYPLTLNALLNACNQTSSRDPIVHYDETILLRALDGLRSQKLAYVSSGGEGRVPRYGHKFTERFHLSADEAAALCVLMLRGPQTTGEIRGRSGRLHEFATLADVEATLDSLAKKSPRPLVTKLPRQSGSKEGRYAHLLSGDAPLPNEEADAVSAPGAALSPRDSDRIAALEQQVAAIRAELATVQGQLTAFKKQFE